LIIAAAFLVALSGPVLADLDAVEAALERGDYAAALDELRPLAEQGDAEAQRLLGDLYNNGVGVPINYSLAWTWYTRAANSGNAKAQFKLATMHWNGTGVPKNEEKAVEWYAEAADAGHEQAQLELGLIYRDGKRQIPASPHKAFVYLKMAALAGNFEAELAIEEMFVGGLAPAEEMEAYRAEQEVRSLSEPERIRTAVLDWIDTINRAGGGRPRLRPDVVVTESEGAFHVLIPDLVLTPDEGMAVRLGTLRVELVPEGTTPEEPEEDLMATRRYRVAFELPDRVEFQDGLEVYTLSYQPAEVRGLWLPAISSFVQLTVRLSELALTDAAEHVLFTAGEAAWVADLQETSPGLWSGPSSLEMTALEAFERGGLLRLSVRKVFAGTRFTDLKLEFYGRMVTEMNRDPEGFVASLAEPEGGESFLEQITSMVASSTLDFGVEGFVAYDDDGEQAFAFDRASIGVRARQQDANRASVGLSYSHAGLVAEIPDAGVGQDLLPRAADLVIDVGNIPVQDIGRAALEMFGQSLIAAAQADGDDAEAETDLMMSEFGGRMIAALNEAGTDIKVELSFDSAVTAMTLAGGVVADPEAAWGLSGGFELVIGDLDRLIALTEQDPLLAAYGAVVMAFAEIAERGEPSAERPAPATFTITIERDGAVMVNGQNAVDISVETLGE
jgi:hypothetical protein